MSAKPMPDHLWRRTAAAVLLLCVPLVTWATNDMRGLVLLQLSQICAAQDPVYREGIFGNLVYENAKSRGATWEKFDQQPLWKCLRQRQWAPKSICTTVNRVDPSDRVQLDQWFDAHANTLRALSPVMDFVASARTREEASSDECPTIDVVEKPAPESGFRIERTDLIWAGEYEGSPRFGSEVTLRKKTDRIAARLGTRFGINFNVVSQPSGGILTVTYRITVPEPGIPSGNSGERKRILDDRPQCIPGRPCQVGFVFESEDELVPGIWRMEVFFGGKKLIEHEFAVETATY